MKKINTPLDSKKLQSLKAGEEVFLSGTLYTARDQAHKRMVDTIGRGGESPFDFKGAVVYYCGPTRTPKGKAIGSCGPTTSGRMDVFTPALLAKGLKAMIGKGDRSPEVKKAIKKYKGIYFVTYAGCAAFLAGAR
jgi:fumarate hydratase subunit beta